MRNGVLLILLIVFAHCVLSSQSQPSLTTHAEPAKAETEIEGAGSPGLDLLLTEWIDEYSRLHPEARIAYRAVGSTAGLRMLTAGTSSFATTDIPIAHDQLAVMNRQLVQFPVSVTAVIPVYNLPEAQELRLSGTTLADIFLGKVTRWNHAAIMKDNPGARLPDTDIKASHYFPNGNVETNLMGDYLSRGSPAFKRILTSVSGGWPLKSMEFKGGEGTAGFVSITPGSIGYLGLGAARLYKQKGSLKWGAVKNSDGDFVTASPDSLTSAAGSAAALVQAKALDFRISIIDAPGKQSYPIASFTWFVLNESSNGSPEERKENEIVKDFLKWVLTDGQKSALKLGYPALPGKLVDLELQRLNAIRHNSK